MVYLPKVISYTYHIYDSKLPKLSLRSKGSWSFTRYLTGLAFSLQMDLSLFTVKLMVQVVINLVYLIEPA